MLFSLGEIVVTQGIAEQMRMTEIRELVKRHWSGDWGDVCKEDIKANEKALAAGDRLFSMYISSTGVKTYA